MPNLSTSALCGDRGRTTSTISPCRSMPGTPRNVRKLFGSLKEALLADNTALNDSKQQVMGIQREVLQLRPGDQPLRLRGYAPAIEREDPSPADRSRRTCLTGGTQRARCNIAASLLFRCCLYGAKCHYIAECQFASMRRVMHNNGGCGSKPKGWRSQAWRREATSRQSASHDATKADIKDRRQALRKRPKATSQTWGDDPKQRGGKRAHAMNVGFWPLERRG